MFGIINALIAITIFTAIAYIHNFFLNLADYNKSERLDAILIMALIIGIAGAIPRKRKYDNSEMRFPISNTIGNSIVNALSYASIYGIAISIMG